MSADPKGLFVLRAARRHVWLLKEGQALRLRVRGGERLVPGDRVVPAPDGGVDAPEPRRNVLRRRTPRGERILAANLDRLVVLLAHATQDGGEGFIARCVAAALGEGIAPLLVFNKADLDTEGSLEARAARHRELGFESLVISARTGAGLPALESRLMGRVSALVGFSGTGKSSLVNALHLEAKIPEGEVDARGRGRHTTTLGQAYPWAGGALIDLPGVRSFGLVTGDGLAAAFPEITRWAQACRFSDCRHEAEPECAVKAAVARGEVDPDRLDIYHGIREGLDQDLEGHALSRI